jgi:hypothetical protein
LRWQCRRCRTRKGSWLSNSLKGRATRASTRECAGGSRTRAKSHSLEGDSTQRSRAAPPVAGKGMDRRRSTEKQNASRVLSVESRLTRLTQEIKPSIAICRRDVSRADSVELRTKKKKKCQRVPVCPSAGIVDSSRALAKVRPPRNPK